MTTSAIDLTRLDGRVAVLTGAAQGLGATATELFAQLGASVVLLDVNDTDNAALAEKLAGLGHRALAIHCDVAQEAEVETAARRVQEEFGRADVLVNNAGIISWTPLEDLPVEEWDRVTNINLRGTFLCTKHFGRLMIEQRSGSIINVSSVAGTAPEPGAGAYAATKAAVIMLARQTAVEWGQYSIRANAVSPGMMKTPMAERFLSVPEALERRVAMVPLRRIGEAHEVARVIAYLGSDAASYVSGQNIEVDGGMMQMLIQLLPRPGVTSSA